MLESKDATTRGLVLWEKGKCAPQPLLKKVLWESEVSLESIAWVSWCIRKRAPNSLVFAALRTLRQKHRIRIVGFFVVCSVECSWFLVVMPEKHAKTQGFVVCECGEVFQYIKKAMRFTVYLQQTSKFAGICSTSYTSRTTEIIGSCGFGRFWGLESETGTNPRATCTAAPAQKRV